MQLVTLDADRYLDIPDLENVVLNAIDAQASVIYPSDPTAASDLATARKTIVLGALIGMANYPDDQRAALLGYWTCWGGRRL